MADDEVATLEAPQDNGRMMIDESNNLVSVGLPEVGQVDPALGNFREDPYKYPDDGIAADAPAVEPDVKVKEIGESQPEPKAADDGVIPAHLLAQAAIFDLDPKEFPTAAHLEGALAAQQRFVKSFGVERKPQEPQRRQSETEAEGQPVRRERAPEQPASTSYEPFKIDKDKWDEGTVTVLSELDSHMKKQVEAITQPLLAKVQLLESQLAKPLKSIEALSQSHANAERMRAVSEFDSTVGALGKTWEPIFGAGDHEDVLQGSAQFVARDKVFRLAAAICTAAQQNGQRANFKKAIQQAAYATFPEHVKALAQDEVRANTKNRQRQFSNPPTRREPTEPVNSEQKAFSNLKRKMREFAGD